MSDGLSETFRCTCHNHVFVVDDWGDGETWIGWYEGGGPASWRWRLKTAWRVLRGVDHFYADACLTAPDHDRLVATLNRCRANAEPPTFTLAPSSATDS